MSTRAGGSGSDSGSGIGAGVRTIDECMYEFISSKVTRNILEWTLVISGSVKQEILELLDGRFRAFSDRECSGAV